MKFLHGKISLLVFGIGVLYSELVWSADELPEIKLVTTHPSMDFSPAVSPDGQWLAFTSERSGNLDIWVKKLPRGQTVQVTIHQAEDTQPTWSPDGKHLAFVSKRRDAQGDIWLVELDLKKGGKPRGRPVQLTNYLGLDRHPSFSPDGRKIVFVSDRRGTENLWILDVESGAASPLTLFGGTDPAWSPSGNRILFTSFRLDKGGDLFLIEATNPEKEGQEQEAVYPVIQGKFLEGQGAWSPSGDGIVFVRFDTDTDRDGKITAQDHGSLWIKQMMGKGVVSPEDAGQGEIQITTEVYHDSEPCWSRENGILFTSLRGGRTNIWSIPSEGVVVRAPSAAEQYSRTMDRFAEAVTREALSQAILSYQKVEVYFPEDSLWCSRSLIQIGEIFHILGDEERAERAFKRVREHFPNQTKEGASAELKLATLTLDPIEVRIQRCQNIMRLFPEERSTVAEAWIVLGDLYREFGDRGQSFVTYGQVMQSFSELRHLTAQARIKMGDLFKEDGQEETARQSYLTVLREYGDIPLWRNRAVERILDQIQGSSQERIQGYQQIIQEAQDIPSLASEAQLAIGRVLVEQHQLEQALRELERVERVFPSLLWAHAEAKILSARIYGMMGDDLRGIFLLEDVINTYGSLEGGRFTLIAQEALFEILFQSAEKLKAGGDYALAEARYRRAVELRPQDIRTHRGLVEAGYRNGKIEKLIQEYQERLKDAPRDPIFLYGLGLAYSYWGEREPEYLKKSNVFLTRSLAEDYRLIYPYRTLSFNYELLEKLDEQKRKKESSGLVRAGKMILAPFRWLVGLLPFGKEVRGAGYYYESAIQALITAMELNDENTDPKLEALLAQNLANNFYNLGEFGFKKAYQYYQARLVLDSTFTQPLEKAVFYERAGHCGVVLQEAKSASGYLLKAIRIYTDLGREEDVLRNLKMLAFLYHLDGMYEDAISVYEKTVAQDERMGRWDEVERGYRNIAYDYHLMEEPEDALKYARMAEKILLQNKISIHPPKGNALRIEVFGLSIPVWRMEDIGGASAEGFTLADELALVYGLISQSLEALKNYEVAVDYELKRLDIFQKQKDKLAERVGFHRLGRLYYLLSDFDKAWDYFYLSWEKSTKSKDPRGRWVNAVNLGNVATVELSILGKDHHAERALLCLEEERKRLASDESGGSFRERLILMNTFGTIWTLQAKRFSCNGTDRVEKVQSTLRCMDQLSKAAFYFEEGLKIARERGFWREEGIFLKNLSEVATLAHDDSAAYAHLQESCRVLEAQGEEDLLWRVLYQMANLLRGISERMPSSQDKRKDPLAYYQQAMDLLESLPVQEERSEERLSDREDRWTLYVDAAFEMARQGKTESALETVERGREKQAADLLARRPPELRRERHKIAWGNVRYVRTRMKELEKQIVEAKKDPEKALLLPGLTEEKKKYEAEYRQMMESLREEDAVLAYFSGAEPADIKAVQSILPPNAGVLCYLVGSQQTAVWAVDRDTLFLKRIEIDQTLLQSKTEEFSLRIEKDSLANASSQELYNILLRPLDSFIQEKETLVIVPDDFLWKLPFGAFSNGEKILIERMVPVYSPSLMAYRLAWERRKINQEKGLLVGETQDTLLAIPMKQTMKTVQAILGEEAKPSFFRQAVPTADVVQIETWMTTHEKDPLTSSLMLSPTNKEGGFIKAEDLFALDLRASLFLLPSPRERKTNDYLGSLSFVQGLLYAGVPSVAVSEWPVPRNAKALFGEIFYRNLDTLSVADALAEAQLRVREHYPEMRAWAGFRMIGFGGMTPVQKVRFARDNLVAAVLKGRAFEQKGEYSDAVETLERAQDMAKAMGDSTSLKNIYSEIFRVSIKGKLWAKAIEYQKHLQIIAERRGDPGGVWSSIKNLVGLYIRSGQLDNAVQTKMEAIRFVQEGSGEEDIAASYEELAFIYARNREYKEAIQWADTAYTVYEKRGDLFGQGKALIRKGRFELEGDRYWEARKDLSVGVSQLESFIKSSPEEKEYKIELASGYQLLGLACEKLTLYDEALQHQEKGLDLFTELRLATPTAQGLQYLANIHWKMGHYRNALAYERKALESFTSQGDEKLLASAYSTQGLIYMSLGDLPKAKKAEETALDFAEKSESFADQATILKNLGLVALQEKDLKGAYEAFQRASVIDSSLEFRSGLAYDNANLGTLSIQMQRIDEGILFFKNGLRLSQEIGDKRSEVRCLYGLGQAYCQKGELKAALGVLDSAETVASHLMVPDVQWRIYRQRAVVLSQMGRKEALSDYTKAVEIVEGMRAELKVEAFKQGFLDDKMDLYIDMVLYLQGMGKTVEAFDFVERAKSRNFIDLLGNQGLVLVRAQGELLSQEQSARVAVQEAQDRLAAFRLQEKADSKKGQEEMAYWEDALNKRRKTYEAILVSIQEESPELASFVNVDPWSTDRIQNILPDSTAMVEYFLTPNQLFLWMLSSEKIVAKKIDISEEAIRTKVRKLRENIQSHLSSDLEGRDLYKWLVDPLEKELRSIRHIVFVSHGILHYLPYAALQDGEGHYLVERFSLSTVPSATVLGYCMEKRKAAQVKKTEERILALSNPDLGDPRYDLPFAEKEVKALGRSYQDVTPFFGKEVTEKVIRDRAASYGLIHFACHATYEPEAPLFSALLLSPAGNDDGRLEAHEIFGLKLNCDLITLSACETGLGQITRGDEIIGLTRSFIFAGTPSIVTSLWKVDDLATAVMVKRFYRYLKAGYSKAEALRKAQLLVKEEVNGHPAAWAAFELTGDFR